jgi:hypothetical protein
MYRLVADRVDTISDGAYAPFYGSSSARSLSEWWDALRSVPSGGIDTPNVGDAVYLAVEEDLVEDSS